MRLSADELRERLPWLFHLGGGDELLLIADKPGRDSLAAPLTEAGYRVTLLEPRRNLARGAERSQAFVRVIQGLPQDVASIASLLGLQWDVVLWWHRMDAVSYEDFVRSLPELQLVTRKAVIVGDPHHARSIKDLGLRGYQPIGNLGVWYGGQWTLTASTGTVETTPVLTTVSGTAQTLGPVPSCEELGQVTAIVVGFNTKDLTRQAITTLRQAYPKLSIILIDNSSSDGSIQDAARLASEYNVHLILNGTNVGHGPAIHQGIRVCETPYVLLLDSDCIVRTTGFIEAMLEAFSSDSLLYAIGWLRHVDRYSGVPIEWHTATPPIAQFCRYIHPCCALLDRKRYLALPPAIHHGAPLLENMRAVEKTDWHLQGFVVELYVEHLIAGTRRRYAGRWDPTAREKPGKWNEGEHLPI